MIEGEACLLVLVCFHPRACARCDGEIFHVSGGGMSGSPSPPLMRNSMRLLAAFRTYGEGRAKEGGVGIFVG
jgi:hypothetical protein